MIRQPVGVILCCLGALAVMGCANSQLPSWLPFRDKPDHLDGVPAPRDRIESLRKLTEKAESTPPDQKATIAQDLVNQIQREEDPLIRAEIIRALARYPSPAGDAVLRAALNDPAADVRVIACGAWGNRGGPEAAALLAGILSSDIDRDVRMAAARALSKSRDPAAIAALGNVLEDNDPAMQYCAVRSLQGITGENLGNDVDRWRQYAKEGKLKPAESSSFAGRMGRLF
jgi:hypothetical protein